MLEYEVTLSRLRWESATIRVTANSMQEATNIAVFRDELGFIPDWDHGDTEGDLTVMVGDVVVEVDYDEVQKLFAEAIVAAAEARKARVQALHANQAEDARITAILAESGVKASGE